MSSVRTVELVEAGFEQTARLSVDTAAEIVRLGIASVTPVGGDTWRIGGISKVGVVRVRDIELRIRPKVPLTNLFHMLARGAGWGTWLEQDVELDTTETLYPVVAAAFAHHAGVALRGGVLRGYRITEAAESAIRGRWMVAEQIRRRQGLVLPAEVQFDDYTADIVENRLIRSATRRLLNIPGLPPNVRGNLMRIDRALAEATLLTSGTPVPSVRSDRRNARLTSVLALSRLILRGGSLDDRVGITPAAGFLLDMAQVFEAFVFAELQAAVGSLGDRMESQVSTHLDVGEAVTIRPDVLWKRGGEVIGVFDAKYKAEKPSGFPNADVYQMLAYCIRFGLTEGHLIYAAGNETATHYDINSAGVRIICHALSLDLGPEAMFRQISNIVDSSQPAR